MFIFLILIDYHVQRCNYAVSDISLYPEKRLATSSVRDLELILIDPFIANLGRKRSQFDITPALL